MMKVEFLVLIVIALLAALSAWRAADRRAESQAWQRLLAQQPANPAVFLPSMVSGLPEPARRYFQFAIKPGTPLLTVAEIDMAGRLSLGTKDKPGFMPMRATQVLAAPQGFVWRPTAGRRLRFVGSDGTLGEQSWTRFWLFGVLPFVRTGNNVDHRRSAFGRYVAEAVFWTPAALLPAAHVRWAEVDDDTARVTVSVSGIEQAVDVRVDRDGRPRSVVFQRWSDANPDKVFQLQPFGGTLDEYREFAGFRLPTRIDAGNFFGTDDYFPFFQVSVSDIRFPEPASRIGASPH